MRINTCLYIVFLTMGLADSLLYSANLHAQQDQKFAYIKTMDGCKKFVVEHAVTRKQRQAGLMFRENLATAHGMLFIYEQPRQVSMWMKNTPLSLDILFIEEDGRVVKIIEKAEPLQSQPLSSGQPVIAVLEINAGESKQFGISVGDRVFY